MDKATQRDRLNQAADQVRRCEANLKAARSDTLSVPDSWDSGKRGQARVHKMVRRNNELRKAEEEYRAALQEVEREAPLGEASELSEPEAHIIAAALSIAGSSLGDSALERIEQWKSMIPEGLTAAFGVPGVFFAFWVLRDFGVQRECYGERRGLGGSHSCWTPRSSTECGGGGQDERLA